MPSNFTPPVEGLEHQTLEKAAAANFTTPADDVTFEGDVVIEQVGVSIGAGDDFSMVAALAPNATEGGPVLEMIDLDSTATPQPTNEFFGVPFILPRGGVLRLTSANANGSKSVTISFSSAGPGALCK